MEVDRKDGKAAGPVLLSRQGSKWTQEALSMMESAAAEAARGLGGGGDNVAAEGERGNQAAEVEDIRPFAVATEAIRVALSREAEMRQELKHRRASARWVWISSAIAGFSATTLASIAFVSRGR